MSDQDWNPTAYERFQDDRTRPARDLCAQILVTDPKNILDIGCGSGTSTELLAQRWPSAHIAGIDTSPAMLDSAAKRVPTAQFLLQDVATYEPPQQLDVIFSNAALQWVPDHGRLFPRLMSYLTPGGVLAIQMPDNLDEPSHRAMAEVAMEGPWMEKLVMSLSARTEIASAEGYYDILRSCSDQVTIWKTVYSHVLDGPEAIVDWFRSTGLKPFIDPLDANERAAFLAAYQAKIVTAYPPRKDGKVLLHFPRRFLIAIK